MINENIKVEKIERIEYPPIPEDVYQVELLDINMEEKPSYNDKTKLEKVLSFQFTLLNGKHNEESLRGRNIWRNFVPVSLYIGKNGKNVLYQIIEALYKRELTREEESLLETKRLNKLIGKQCRVVIKHTKKDDIVYNNISNFLIAENSIEKLTNEEKEQSKVKKNNSENEKNNNEMDYEVDTSDISFQ